MTRSDNTQLLIAVFKQWQSARIDTNKLGEDLGINGGAAGMRLFRLKARLRTGEGPTTADVALLTAIINQERLLPRLDYTLLGADLEINPRAAAMRWWRYKVRPEGDARIVQQQEREREIIHEATQQKTRLLRRKEQIAQSQGFLDGRTMRRAGRTMLGRLKILAGIQSHMELGLGMLE
ncbi:uncharacterized protein EAF02_001008 [Botrytis sinoallii]|uniref:uncharacterized protein n=1 Tax=Botrytis sinoallii TaxID=1463999 RepID=UPI00190177A6|nr:uncharacterized protein EAF02_001008 [Botrytis sinoallii]KAF7893470.1 hypothetical protein EAF02_001008 [Botrytis sinoallii]